MIGRESDGTVKFWHRFFSEEDARTRLSELSSIPSGLRYSIQETLSIIPDRTLPTLEQVRSLCGILHQVLVLIRSLSYNGRTEAIINLTDRLHNLPTEMFDPVNWDWNALEASLVDFENHFPEDSFFKFSETIRKIRSSRAERLT